MSEAKLGTIPKGNEGRDAIHIAIVPACAAELLARGQPVKLNASNHAEPCAAAEAIGVVDPFRKDQVAAGAWFWLCLYPSTVTGLRHIWEHPSFPKAEVSFEQQTPGGKAASENWLKDYVRKHCPYWSEGIEGFGNYKGHPPEADGGYSEFLRNVVDERYIYYYGSDCHSLEDVEDAEELFHHLSVVLNRRIDASYFRAFTCSC